TLLLHGWNGWFLHPLLSSTNANMMAGLCTYLTHRASTPVASPFKSRFTYQRLIVGVQGENARNGCDKPCAVVTFCVSMRHHCSALIFCPVILKPASSM